MQAPNDRLDDGFVNGKDSAGPPRMKLVRPSGDVELLKPVAAVRPMQVKNEAVTSEDDAPDPLSHRALAIGAGAGIALLAFAVLSGIFFGMQEPDRNAVISKAPSEPQAEKTTRAPKEPGPIVSFPAEAAPVISVERTAPSGTVSVASSEKRFVAAASFRRGYRRPLPRPKMVISNFVPTKLVIYPQDGVIKSRIEPQLAAFSKPQSSFSN